MRVHGLASKCKGEAQRLAALDFNYLGTPSFLPVVGVAGGWDTDTRGKAVSQGPGHSKFLQNSRSFSTLR